MPRTLHPRTAAALEATLAALGYAALSKGVAVVTSIGVDTGATFWPGAGLSLALLSIRPRRRWPAILAGVAAAEVAVDLHLGFSLGLALAWAVANTVEPLIGAHLLAAGRSRPPELRDPDTVVRFILAAVVVGPLAGALVGTGAAVVVAGDPWLPRLPRWYVGDAMGVLAVAPALLAARREAWRFDRRAVATAPALALVTAVAFWPWGGPAAIGLPYLVIPVLVLLGIRAGVGAAAVGVLAVAAVVQVVTAVGSGPFGTSGAFDGLVVAQLFLFMAATTALLVAALTTALLERTRSEATLRSEALTDGLTGLANRRLLDDRLAMAVGRLERGDGLAVVVVDLDGLKQVNDRLGHRCGDALLVATAARLAAAIRPGDTAARLGGDEFVVVCEGVAGEAAVDELGGRMAAAVSRPVDWEGVAIDVRASVGVAWAGGGKVVEPARLLDRADGAMYEAKRAGGGVAVARTRVLHPAPEALDAETAAR
ncbi:MAG: diguanylate cyclase domain-containing protein [Acidimicrobiia bacterium]